MNKQWIQRKFWLFTGMFLFCMIFSVGVEASEIYENEKYHYQIARPDNWTVKEESPENVLLFSLSKITSVWISVIPTDRQDSYGDFLLDEASDEEALVVAKFINQSLLAKFPDFSIQNSNLTTEVVSGHRAVDTLLFPTDRSQERSPILVTAVVRGDQTIMMLSTATSLDGMERDIEDVLVVTKSMKLL